MCVHVYLAIVALTCLCRAYSTKELSYHVLDLLPFAKLFDSDAPYPQPSTNGKGETCNDCKDSLGIQGLVESGTYVNHEIHP